MLKRIRSKPSSLICVLMIVLAMALAACGSDPTAVPSPVQGTPVTTAPATTTQATTGSSATTAPPNVATVTPANSTTSVAPSTSSTTNAATTTAATPKAATRPNILMKDFIGVNQDYKLQEDSTQKDFARVSKWLRDYAKWYCLEPEENNFGGVTGTAGCGTSPDFFNYSAFYNSMQAAGINVLHVSEYTTAFANWAGQGGDFPPLQKEGQGQKPDDFLKHSQYLYQLAAMFGGNKNVPAPNLTMPNSKAGQNFIQAVENWNEPDGWWKGKGQFSKEQFYNMLVADYDGDGGRLPKAGVKQADPNMKFVMGGLATTDLSYLYGVLAYANQNGKKFPADVLNFHEYASDGKTGITPESAHLVDSMQKIGKWRDSYLPNGEVWVTEFGWDTFAKGSEHSKIYAGEQNQANWILRGLVMYRAAGADKAFIFLYNDDEIGSTETYLSSGLVTLKNDKKPSYYYLGTLQDMIGEMYLDRQVTTGRDDVMNYLFRNPKGSNGVFTVWKTSGDGSKLDNFSLTLPAGVSQNCTAVVPNKNGFTPTRTPLTVVGGKINLTVSETMTFVACDNVGDNVGAGIKANTPGQDGPAVGANGRLALASANLFENTPTATDPASDVPLSALIDEQKIVPDDPQATAPQTQWFPLTAQNGFALDLHKGLDLGRLDWFNAGGDKSGFEVFYAPPGQYGNWKPLTTILNEGNFYGQWMSVQLTATNVQYLQFVPKAGSTEAKLGEIALYTKGATPLVPNKPAASGTSAPANGTAVAATSPTAVAFSPIGTPPAGGAPVVAAIPTEGRLAIVNVAAQGNGNIKAAFDGKTDSDWRVADKPDYAQFSLALDGVHTLDQIRYFVFGTEHAPNTTIQYSADGQSWTTLKGADGINTGANYGWNEINAGGIKAKYIRFILKNVPDKGGDKIFELGYYGEIQVIGN